MMRDATVRITLILRREPQSLRMMLSLGRFGFNGLKLFNHADCFSHGCLELLQRSLKRPSNNSLMNESRRQQIFYSVVDKDDLFIDTENFFWKTQKLFYRIILS